MIAKVDATLAALADPTRRAVVGLLSRGPRRPSDLAEALATSRPEMSRHLRVLRHAGLVRDAAQDDDARSRWYTLRRAPLDHLSTWLAEVEAFWTDQLGSFKAHAERRHRSRK